jgi:hypothetical protein
MRKPAAAGVVAAKDDDDEEEEEDAFATELESSVKKGAVAEIWVRCTPNKRWDCENECKTFLVICSSESQEHVVEEATKKIK